MSARRTRSFWGAKYLGFRCSHCGHCCRDTIVPVTGSDVARLREGTGLSVARIVSFFAPDEFEDEGDGLTFIDLDVGRRTMGLRRAHDPKGDRCAFFQGDRCSVYEHRPTTCRLWPFTVRFDERGRIS